MELLIEKIWNGVAEVKVGQANNPQPRNYISASDIGKAYIDRYYKMKGFAPTNPYDERVLRIFDAGKLFEWIVGRSLAMAGVLKERQSYCEIPASNENLKVLGYIDYLMGGIANWNEARGRIKKWLVEFKLDEDNEILEKYSLKLIDGFEKEFGDRPIPETILEVKSINSLAFWGHKNRNEDDQFIGYDHHRLQLLAYMLAKKLDKGHLLYVSKDDLCLQQVPVLKGGELEEKFWVDVKQMSEYFSTDTTPSPLPELVFNKQKNVFELNWEVARSLYLTKIYGYKDKEQFENKKHQELLDVNRAFRHLKDGLIKKEDKPIIKKFGLEILTGHTIGEVKCQPETKPKHNNTEDW